MLEHEEWICPNCGKRNADRFCENCGTPRPVTPPGPGVDQVSDETQEMPRVSEPMDAAPGQTFGPAGQMTPQPVRPTPAQVPPMGPVQAPPSKNNRTVKILSGVAIVLLLAVIGVFAYISGAEGRYEKKAMEAEQVTMDARNLVLDIKSLQGTSDSDQDKDFIDRVEKAKGNLDQLSGSLKSMRTGSKYQSVNKDLVEAVMLETTVLDDVHTVLADPTGGDAPKAVARVKDHVAELKDRGAKIQIGAADFTQPMDLTGLDQQLTGYIQKRKAAEAAAKAKAAAEAAAKAKAEAEARAKALQQKKAKRIQEELNAADSVDYIATDLQLVGHQAKLSGYFLNKTPHPIMSIDSSGLEIKLYKDGEIVYDWAGQLGKQVMNGWLYPNQRRNAALNVFLDDEIPDFDDFRVYMSNTYWTYHQN